MWTSSTIHTYKIKRHTLIELPFSLCVTPFQHTQPHTHRATTTTRARAATIITNTGITTNTEIISSKVVVVSVQGLPWVPVYLVDGL